MSAPHDPNHPPRPPPPQPPVDQPQAPPVQAPPPTAPPPAQPPQAVQPAAAGLVEGWAVKRSVVRVVLLILGGTYILYWFYKTRPKVTAELGTYDNVTAQTWGLIVPILNWFIIYWLLRDIAQARLRLGMPNDLDPVVMLVIWFFVTPVGIGLSQNQLNEYWDRRSNGYATDAPLGFIEVFVAYGLWLVLILLGIIAAIIAVAVS
jgi:hypothetical protein